MSAPQPHSIREANVDDAGKLALVGVATFLDAYAGLVDGDGIVQHCQVKHSAQAYRDLFAAGARVWLVEIEPGAAPIGYAVTTPPDLEQAGEGDRELRRIYLLSRFHGSGIARALVDSVIAATAGHSRLLLGVKDDNHRALRFYRKHGFAEIGTRRFTVGAHTYDDFVLARDLTNETTSPS